MPRVVAKSSIDIAIPPGESILVFSQDSAQVFERVGSTRNLLGTINAGSQAFGPFANGAIVIIDAGEHIAWFSVGAAPIISEMLVYKIQRAPTAISTSGAIPISALSGGLINASAGLLGLTGTLPTGAAIDAASDFLVDDAFDWSVISTGLGAYTLAASAGHSIVGSASVGSAQSAAFRTRKTGAGTFVTYRMG